jgi:hypothetical protein
MILSVCMLFSKPIHAQPKPGLGQLPPFTKWHQNPLGVSPVSLHTANGILIPAVAATAMLLFTKRDATQRTRWGHFNDGGFSKGYYGSKTSVFQNNTGMLFFARPWMALGGELTMYYVRDAVNNTWGFGLRPFVRFYLVRQDRFKLFFESGAGLIAFADQFPQPSGFFGDNRTGTRVNGSPKYGAGGEFIIGPKLSVMAGWRHVHVSNGNHPGRDRNPGHDSNGFHIGLLHTPAR